MSSAPVRKDAQTAIASAIVRGSKAAAAGSRKVT